jgi:uncharacterized protein
MDFKKFINSIIVGAHLLKEKEDEINKLNVFPVPDGDTGTNMSLTLKSVEDNLNSLPANAQKEQIIKAITTGALMGARGNSGVITSQILRGVCEGISQCDELSTDTFAKCLTCAKDVAYQAVRKPVKGTILTVLSDCASASVVASDERMSLQSAMEYVVVAAYDSVKSTPEYLPVLKENNVVDAGGYGLAIFLDGFVCSMLGKEQKLNLDFDVSTLNAPKVEIEQINDWEGSKFRYCNEFLVDSDKLVIEDALNFLSTMGDCELCVGATPKFKVHVHSNEPDKVLKYFLNLGQISEVHIHNMQLQSQDRIESLKTQSENVQETCVVAVAVGQGNVDILKSLDVDVVVSGGQTMNPSIKDLLDAAKAVEAKSYLFFPNNSNIIMAAQSACELLDKPAMVIPTKSVLECFSALFSLDKQLDAKENYEEMKDIIGTVKTGEVTVAVKDSHDAKGNLIHAGDVIGIMDGEILAVNNNICDCVLDLMKTVNVDDYDNCTILWGEDATKKDKDKILKRVKKQFSSFEVDPHDGGQPLYPVVFSLE